MASYICKSSSPRAPTMTPTPPALCTRKTARSHTSHDSQKRARTWTFIVLETKVHLPRSTSTMAPSNEFGAICFGPLLQQQRNVRVSHRIARFRVSVPQRHLEERTTERHQSKRKERWKPYQRLQNHIWARPVLRCHVLEHTLDGLSGEGARRLDEEEPNEPRASRQSQIPP